MNDDLVNLGRLEPVSLRQIWESEPTDFTPWLAVEDNLRLLGSAIGFDLELEAQEKEVGPFRADLLCKDRYSEQWVLIENQLEKTDHDHLGKLLTYAAGLKTVTIVWIAARFTDEHRAALDWLNDITDSRFSFFGLEVELWKIGDSPVAPKFNVVSKPNDWSREMTRQVTKTEGTTETQQLQLEYWTVFHDYLAKQGSSLRPRRPLPKSELHVTIGKTKVWLQAVASRWDSDAQSHGSNEIRVELIIQPKELRTYFNALKEVREEIEQAIGESLNWQEHAEKRRCISIRQSADLEQRDVWEEQHAWLMEHLEAFYQVFAPRIKAFSDGEPLQKGASASNSST
jgi:hypothetical protein